MNGQKIILYIFFLVYGLKSQIIKNQLLGEIYSYNSSLKSKYNFIYILQYIYKYIL